jgi:hypothetical protein
MRLTSVGFIETFIIETFIAELTAMAEDSLHWRLN